MKQWAHKQKGFTIVELLIVVVVIAILAAITIVAYSGITNRSKESALLSDLATAYKKLETQKIQDPGQSYPLTQAATGINASGGATFSYVARQNGVGYCAQSQNGTLRYFITSSISTPAKGSCQNLSLWLRGSGSELSGYATAVSQNSSTSAPGPASAAAYSFNGSQRIVAASHSAVNLTQGSVSLWVNRVGVNGLIFAAGAPGTSGAAAVSSLTIRLVNGQLYGGWADGAASNPDTDQAVSNGVLASGQWYHVVTSWTTSPSNVRVYIDGTAQTIQDVHSNNNKNAWLDQIVLGGNDTAGSYSGLIADVRVYDTALTDAEVSELYGNGAQ